MRRPARRHQILQPFDGGDRVFLGPFVTDFLDDTGAVVGGGVDVGAVVAGAMGVEQNREDARVRLAALVRTALEPPKPRVATKPTRSSQRRRLETKRLHGTLKQDRSKRHLSDD